MKYLLCLIVLPLLFACKNHESPPASGLPDPDTIIGRSQMVRILTDVHLTEAALGYLKTKDKLSGNIAADYYDAVFSKYRISRKSFELNYDYYSRQPDEMIKIYEDVISNLEILKKQNQVEGE